MMKENGKRPLFAAAEKAALARELVRYPYNAEIGQLEWLRRRREGESMADAPWDAIVPGIYRWLEQGQQALAREALSALPDDSCWRLDRMLLKSLLTDHDGVVPAPATATPLLIATNIAVLRNRDAMSRQRWALDCIDTLAGADGGITLLNAYVAGEEKARDGWIHRRLPRTARDVVDPTVPPIPIVKDLLDLACAEARQRGILYFGYFNSDVQITPHVITLVREVIHQGYECQAYVRTDVPSCRHFAPKDWIEIHLSGTDFFVISTDWWEKYRDMTEDYVLGSYWWDCVLVGQMMMHANFFYASHLRGLLFHARHRSVSSATRQVEFNNQLRQRHDEIYFELQTRYSDQLRTHVARNRSLPSIAANRKLIDMETQGLFKMIRVLKR